MAWKRAHSSSSLLVRSLLRPAQQRRLYSEIPHRPSAKTTSRPILHLPRTSIYAHGTAEDQNAILSDVAWTVHPHEAWAVISSGHGTKKSNLLQALLGLRKLHPYPSEGLYPFLGNALPHTHVELVSFAHRPKAAGSGFQDFTARYGALRDEDKRTLREVYFPEIARSFEQLAIQKDTPMSLDQLQHDEKYQAFMRLAEQIELTQLLDLPVIALSNGQTRKARIIQHILKKPSVLILDEPLTGLDVATRKLLLEFLGSLHLSSSPDTPHIILSMRHQDTLPEWITHIAFVSGDDKLRVGKKDDILSGENFHAAMSSSRASISSREVGEEVIGLEDVNVSYGERHVLRRVSWTIRANSRWHLMGANGSGKTTLLALLTGEHPQSYVQADRLRLFGCTRDRWPTTALAAQIGRVSPELHNAFPRRQGMSVWDVVGTGFTGSFVPHGRRRLGVSSDGTPLVPGSPEEAYRLNRMWSVLEGLGPRAWKGRALTGGHESQEDKDFAARMFVDLTPGEQGMVLLMRALVNQPPLVLLDEVWSGMDENMVAAAKRYLKDGGGGLLPSQACIVISHWEDEVPWTRAEGVQRFLLQDGEGREVH